MALPALNNDESERLIIEGSMMIDDSIQAVGDKIVDVLKAIEYTMSMTMINVMQEMIDQNTQIIGLLKKEYNADEAERDRVESEKDTSAFAADEAEAEAARSQPTEKLINTDKLKAFGSKLTNSLFSILGGAAALGFLYFLPEILDSKFFKEGLKFMKETLWPALVSLWDDYLLPIVQWLGNSLGDLFEDFNDPNKTGLDILKENFGIIALVIGGIAAKIIGLSTILSGVGPALASAGALISAPVALFAAGAAAFVTGMIGATEALENGKEILDKEKLSLTDKISLAIGGFIGGVLGIFDWIAGLFGIETNFKETATKGISNFIADLFDSLKILIVDALPAVFQDKAAEMLGVDTDLRERQRDRQITDNENKLQELEKAKTRIEESNIGETTKQIKLSQIEKQIEEITEQNKINKLQKQIGTIDVTTSQRTEEIPGVLDKIFGKSGEDAYRSAIGEDTEEIPGVSDRFFGKSGGDVYSSASNIGEDIDMKSREIDRAGTNVVTIVDNSTKNQSSMQNNITNRNGGSAVRPKSEEPTLSAMAGL